MRRRVTKTVVLALACVLLAGLAACGGGDDEGGGGSTTAAKDLGGTVTVWDLTYKDFPQYTEGADQLDAEFEKLHPGVTVKHVAVPLVGSDQTFQAAFTGRRGGDVIYMNPGPTGVLSWTKGLEPLNDRITDEMRENLVGWDMLSEDLEGKGDIYGVPAGLTCYVFYYNKKLFAKAGLPTDFQPQTWDEVKEAGLKLKAAGIQPITGGNETGLGTGWWFDVGWQTANTAEEAARLGRGEMSFTDPAVVEAWEPHQMLLEADLFDKDRFTTPLFPDGAARFGEGKGAMTLGLCAPAASYEQYIPTLGEENVGMFFPPGSRYIATPPYPTWTIPAFSKNKDAAWAYIEFVAGKHGQEVLYDAGGILPNHKGVPIAADAPVPERQILEAVRSQKTGPPAELMPSAPGQQALQRETAEVFQGRKSLADGLEAVQEANEKASR